MSQSDEIIIRGTIIGPDQKLREWIQGGKVIKSEIVPFRTIPGKHMMPELLVAEPFDERGQTVSHLTEVIVVDDSLKQSGIITDKAEPKNAYTEDTSKALPLFSDAYVPSIADVTGPPPKYLGTQTVPGWSSKFWPGLIVLAAVAVLFFSGGFL